MKDDELKNELQKLNVTLGRVEIVFDNLLKQQEELNKKIATFQFVATGKLIQLEETVRILSARN